MQTSALFGEKNLEFFETYGLSVRNSGEGVFNPVQAFCRQVERELIFYNFVQAC